METIDRGRLAAMGYEIKSIDTAKPNSIRLWYVYLNGGRLTQYAMSEAEGWLRAAFHSRVIDILEPYEELHAWMGLVSALAKGHGR